MTNDHEEWLHNIATSRKCPVNWDDMSGAEIVRTCKTCGALVFDEQQVATQRFSELVNKYGDPKKKRMFRRSDGKLMLRQCGAGADYSLMPHCLGWTGGSIVILLLLNQFVAPIIPWEWYGAAYAWNVLGAFFVSRSMLNTERRNLTMFIAMVPAAVLIFMGYSMWLRILYWNVFFPAQHV